MRKRVTRIVVAVLLLTGPGVAQDLTPEERRTIEIFRRARPSVVFITSVALRRDFFTLDVQQIPSGTGGGLCETVTDTSSRTST
jgi:hypothetical protein